VAHGVQDELCGARIGGVRPGGLGWSAHQHLRELFAIGAVATEAARRINVSVRTITYRLDKIRALTGLDPGEPTDRFTPARRDPGRPAAHVTCLDSLTLPEDGKQGPRRWPVAHLLRLREVRHPGGKKGTDMTELDVRPTQQAVDLQFYRQELEQQRQFRLDRLTKLAYDAETATDEARRRRAAPDIVERWGLDSFPASDPPANW
jgi:hypothetical protein